MSVRFIRLGRFCVVCYGLFVALVATAQAEHRRALLIGNSKYPKAELVSPPQDIRAVGAALQKRGFVVTQAEDLTAEKMRSTIDDFVRSLPTRSTALVYFSGYALPESKANSPTADNSLLPIDGNPLHEGTVAGSQAGAAMLLGRLATHSGSAFNLLVVDGCYAHPGQDPMVPRGLVKFAKAPPESRILIAAPPSEVLTPVTEGLSPLAKKLSDELNSSKPLGEVLGGLVPASHVFNSEPSTNELAGSNTASPSAPAVFSDLAASASTAIAPPRELKRGTKAGDEWVNEIGMVFVWCPPGRFIMGSGPQQADREDDETQLDVDIPAGFWMGKFEFSRRERFVLAKNFGTYLSTGDHKLQPVNKSRLDTEGPPGMLTKLNEMAPAGWQYALPSEAEWEYAARAGSSTAYSFGDDPAELAKHGNFADRTLRESDSFGEIAKNWSPDVRPYFGDRQTGLFSYAHKTWTDGFVTMAPVGSFPPNPWGLHDMHGNIAELTSTPYHAARTPPDKFDDGVGWVTKGGSWLSKYATCRSAHRGQFTYRARENSVENYLGVRFIVKGK